MAVPCTACVPVVFILGLSTELCSQSVFLQKLFDFLLEYIGDLATDDPPDLRVIDKLVV